MMKAPENLASAVNRLKPKAMLLLDTNTIMNARRTQPLHTAPDLNDALVTLPRPPARRRHTHAQTVGVVEDRPPANEVERPALMVKG